ncbi:Glycosidase [Anaerosporobacter mobilis DSM 15930]|jgi:glycosidase|uniref:Cyclomaltodextrin glucanotransferase n=1 Tax=Anaerosporobacter mobilis DSM 15930 TaxID=1120996 RepID=A0A1M7EK47_9FIRM|nr:alpha-amylase family glycosyl hydrolase [Anaerosporobacter mobilis]SHL91729.1 Glycosidase [Anaerosporobacter mobilis DSM 15930]
MMNLQLNRRNHSLVQKLTSLLFVLIFAFGVIFNNIPVQAATTSTDAEVTNTASFSTDVIYQIVTDRFFDGNTSNNPTGSIFDKSNLQKYHGGDWAGITQKLNEGYFTGMGVTALWISSPVENITTIDPSNNCASYHGYWAKDFFKTNSYFGSVSDFQTMISTAHALGIKIVIDFAPNHTSTAEYGTMTFPEDGALYKNGTYLGGFKNDSQGLFNHESWTDFSTLENSIYHSMYGLADLNHQNATVDTYMKEAIQKWLDYGVDGIRVDAVKHMSAGWQKNWLSSIYSYKPVFVFGEWFNGGVAADADMTKFANDSGMSLLDFRFANAVRNALGSGTATMKDLYNVVTATGSDYEEVNDQVTFIDNHDMSRFMTLASNNQRAVDNAYVILLTSRGVPTIYYGSEQYATGSTDPNNRGDMPSFNTNSTAYKVIGKLAPLRKTNPALAYGTTTERWINNDVMIYERQFGSNVVVTAVNRNQSSSYSISGLYTNLPQGTYTDVMQGTLGGGNITVTSGGAVNTFTLGAGQSAVWQYTASSSTTPLIGNVDPMMGVAGNTVTITGRGFGNTQGSVSFGTNAAQVVSWTDSTIKVIIPSVSAGKYAIKVTTSTGSASNSYSGFEVLSGKQISVRFKVNNATTNYGTNIYLVGNIFELGNWDASKAIGPLFNNTSTIGVYPTWFFDVSVPAGTAIQYKFIKKDASGNVVWESGSNHTVTTPNTGTAEATANWQN